MTPDIAFSAGLYYDATGNTTWLRAYGWPLLQAIAQFCVSRVTPPPTLGYTGAYSIVGVLPVDEWCVASGCGCESPGVRDDAQMNGATKAALIAAASAADTLGYASDESRLWAMVATQLTLLTNETGHHNQFTSPSCPDGWGGSHYSVAHTVCPEDVMLLTYPLGHVLNMSTTTSRLDAELFVPLTCRENAGMTTPIHTIVWLLLNEPLLASAEFNRSMHAACYGPFNVRNEVDKHPDIPGGHFDNTHFATGDGGLLQAVLFGYGGLRVTPGGLVMNKPSLPESVGTITLRALRWRALVLTMTVDVLAMTITASGTFAITDAAGHRVVYQLGARLVLDSFEFPALLTSI